MMFIRLEDTCFQAAPLRKIKCHAQSTRTEHAHARIRTCKRNMQKVRHSDRVTMNRLYML